MIVKDGIKALPLRLRGDVRRRCALARFGLGQVGELLFPLGGLLRFAGGFVETHKSFESVSLVFA